MAPEVFEGAHRLMCVEVITPDGNWSSYPPHRHDGEPDVEGNCIINNEEIYWFRIGNSSTANTYSPDGFAMHRLRMTLLLCLVCSFSALAASAQNSLPAEPEIRFGGGPGLGVGKLTDVGDGADNQVVFVLVLAVVVDEQKILVIDVAARLIVFAIGAGGAEIR